MLRMKQTKSYDKEQIKAMATGREREIYAHVAGIPAEILDRDDKREFPCPKCSSDPGSTRFRWQKEKPDKPLFCSHCFHEGSRDIFAAVMHFRDCTFPET